MNNEFETNDQTIHFSGKTGFETFTIDFEPAAVFPDMDDKICDATTDDDFLIAEPDNYEFKRTFFELDVQSVTGQAFIRVTHNWAPPDSIKEPIPGLLRISDYRYWKVDGIIPEGFEATGKFQYNKYSLDNTLILNQDDSLVILYRQNPASDWQFIDFTQYGIWMLGILYVDNLQKGEYTLAMMDNSVSINEDIHSPVSSLRIFPNPVNDKATIEFDISKEAKLLILDSLGKKVKEFELNPSKKQIIWKTENYSNGLYYIQIIENDKILVSDKIILSK